MTWKIFDFITSIITRTLVSTTRLLAVAASVFTIICCSGNGIKTAAETYTITAVGIH